MKNKDHVSLLEFYTLGSSKRSESGPAYTTTNTQRIAIYPDKFKFVLVKISPGSES